MNDLVTLTLSHLREQLETCGCDLASDRKDVQPRQ